MVSEKGLATQQQVNESIEHRLTLLEGRQEKIGEAVLNVERMMHRFETEVLINNQKRDLVLNRIETGITLIKWLVPLVFGILGPVVAIVLKVL